MQARLDRQRRIRERSRQIAPTRPSGRPPLRSGRRPVTTERLPPIARPIAKVFESILKEKEEEKDVLPDIRPVNLSDTERGIPQFILSDFNLPQSKLMDIKRNVTVRTYRGNNQGRIINQLLRNKNALDICSGGINIGFIKGILQDTRTRGILIKNENEYIGFLFYFFTSENVAEIELLCTLRGQGFPVGQVLMNIMFKVTKQSGRGFIKLESVPDPNTTKFYKRNGFKSLPRKVGGGLLLMQKRL